MGMSLYPYKQVDGNYEFALPRGWYEEEFYPEGFDWSRWINEADDYDLKPTPNPDFRPDMNLGLTGTNMTHIMCEVLDIPDPFIDRDEQGYIVGFMIPIQTFLVVSQLWLVKNRGQVTPAVDGYEHPQKVTVVHEGNVAHIRRGARVIEGGRREGYDEETIFRMVMIAQAGLEHGATHIGAV